MKYSELKQIVEKYDRYDFALDANAVCISSYGGNAVVLHFDGEVEIDIDDVPDDSFPTEILRAVADVMDTPIEEREKVKRYYVHLLPGKKGYLNIDEDDDEVSVGDKLCFDYFETRFTPGEINALADKYPDSAIPCFDKNNPIFEEVAENGND